MSSRLILAGPAFFVTILGVALALAARTLGLMAAAVLIALTLLIAWIADRLAKRSLPYHPRAALWLFWLWSLCPGIIGATAIAVIIYLNATLDPDNLGMAGTDKELLKTTTTALSALLTAMFIKQMDEADEKVIGEHVRDAFFAKFKDSHDPDIPTGAYPVILGESSLEAPVFATDFEDFPAWSGRARWARARAIAAELKDPGEKDRVSRYWEARRASPLAQIRTAIS